MIGSGNIAADLVAKLKRSPSVDCRLVAGRRRDSDGLRFAGSLGVSTDYRGVDAILEEAREIDLVFDATSAPAARDNWRVLSAAGIRVVDLTPSKVGMMCVPALNLGDATTASNVNLVTCGGQAAIPMIADIANFTESRYIELVTTNSAKSLGPASRSYIDEYLTTTQNAISIFSNLELVKAIHIVNPADPPISMQNTIFALVDTADLDGLTAAVEQRVRRLKAYLPGFDLTLPPTLNGDRLTMTCQIEGRGDYLPSYAGNLDVITCAAVEVAEHWAAQDQRSPADVTANTTHA